jgi:uncharacterized protein (TIGR02001 family)
MIKKIALSSFASVILLSQVANAEIKLGDKGSIGTIAFNAGYNSAYVWRGMDQNNGSGSPYIGADLSTPIGFYLGVWTSSAQPSGTAGNNDQELDIYGGIAKTFGSLTFDLGVIEYRYPGADRQGSRTTASNPVNFLEYYGKLKFAPDKAPFSIQLAYYQDDTDGQTTSATIKDKGKNYQEISGTYNFPILTVAASYGEYKGETETTTLTLSKSLFDMNFAATFVDAKKLTNSVAATTFNTSKDFFLNVSKTF